MNPIQNSRFQYFPEPIIPSLRSRRLEVAGERENGRARGRHARGEGASSPLACLLLARPFFLVPTTCKRLLRRLIIPHSPNDLTHNSFRPLVVNNMADTRTMKMNSAPFPAQGKDSVELSL